MFLFVKRLPQQLILCFYVKLINENVKSGHVIFLVTETLFCNCFNQIMVEQILQILQVLLFKNSIIHLFILNFFFFIELGLWCCLIYNLELKEFFNENNLFECVHKPRGEKL